MNLSDSAVTLQLIRQKAVVGVAGTFNGNTLTRVGFTCALCHSAVDNSIARGIGKRTDGTADRDLKVGAIVATAPNLQPVVNRLSLDPQDMGITAPDVRNVLNSRGPGKFDAELFLDGKAASILRRVALISEGWGISIHLVHRALTEISLTRPARNSVRRWRLHRSHNPLYVRRRS